MMRARTDRGFQAYQILDWMFQNGLQLFLIYKYIWTVEVKYTIEKVIELVLCQVLFYFSSWLAGSKVSECKMMPYVLMNKGSFRWINDTRTEHVRAKWEMHAVSGKASIKSKGASLRLQAVAGVTRRPRIPTKLSCIRSSTLVTS